MSKEYSFAFPGTKEDFLQCLNKVTCTDNHFYYFDDYIVEVSGEEIRFGVARGGHSGGYWFIPKITETDNETIFCGKINYIDAYTNKKGVQKIVNGVGELLLFALLLPFIVIFWIYVLMEKGVRKILKRPKPKAQTPEDRLFNLMENYFNCTRK